MVATTWADPLLRSPEVAQRKRTTRKKDDYEQDIDWLVEETAKLKFDLASLVLSIPAAIIRLARGEQGSEPPVEKKPPK